MAEKLLAVFGYSLFVIRYSFKAKSELSGMTIDLAFFKFLISEFTIFEFTNPDLIPLSSSHHAFRRREERPKGVGPLY